MNNKTLQRIIETLEGNVQSQGIKVKFSNWMVIGSEEWNETPDQIKAYAYQAAKVCGWSEESLKTLVVGVYKHIDKDMANFTISELEHLTKIYPLEIK